MEKKYTGWIIIVSILLPVVISLLFFFGGQNPEQGATWSFLPSTYAFTNGLTFFVLIFALIAIKKKNISLHKRLMQLAIGLSIYFLLAYVMYHYSVPATKFGGEGTIKTIYLTILASHIVLSIVLVPLVLFTYVRALAERFDKHRKIAKITFPIWLYVTLTGVVVYLMISPYYIH